MFDFGTKKGAKMSQNGAQRGPKIVKKTYLILDVIFDYFWTQKMSKQTLFLVPKAYFLQEKQNLMKIIENAPRLSETCEFEDPGPSK